MTEENLKKASSKELVDLFAERTWGKIEPDDRFFSNELLQDQFVIFYVYAFAHMELPAPSKVQLEIAEFISDRKNPHRLVWAMRGISKSMSSQIYVVWRLLRNPDEKILVLSSKAGRAKNYTRFCKKLIKMLPITSSMHPRNNVERTSGEQFDVVGAKPSDSPSVYAAGAGNEITGMRSTLNIFDDVETSKNAQSNALRIGVQDSVDEAHNLLMSGHDESITLATPHSMNSLYLPWIDSGTVPFIVPARYPEDESVYMSRLAPFISEAIAKDKSLIGQAIDERIDETFLSNRQRKIGKSKFKLQYLLDVSESDDMKFPLKTSDFIVANIDDDEAPLKISYSSMPDDIIWIKTHNKKNKFYKSSYVSKETAKYEMKLLSLDPSGRGLDEMGITIIFSLNTRLFIKKITGIKGGYDVEVMDNIVNMVNHYGIDTIVVESNYGDGAFLKMLEPHINTKCKDVLLDEIHVKGQKEIRIIENLEPLLNQHRLVVDKDFLDKDIDSGVVYSFISQMTNLSTERGCLAHDDRIDSLSNGVQYMLDKMSDNEERGMDRFIDDANEKLLGKTNNLFMAMYSNGSSGFNYSQSY